MDVFTAISERKSIRTYKDIDVEEEKLNKVLEAARLAPSAANRQLWKFVVVRDREMRKKLAMAAHRQKFLEEAPVIIVACATEGKHVMMCSQPAHTVVLSIACTHIILEAWEQGLGTCWLGTFDENEVKRLLGVPDHARVVTMTPLGYPDEPGRPKTRKSLEEVVCYEKYA